MTKLLRMAEDELFTIESRQTKGVNCVQYLNPPTKESPTPDKTPCLLCRTNLVDEAEFGQPENTCVSCIEFYNERVALAEAEKIKTEGAILKNGLFGGDDWARPTRGKGINTRKKAAPILAIDNRKGRHPTTREITGRPRTGRVLTR